MLDPDAELMLAVKGGDPRAFAKLFDKHARSLVNFAYRFVGDRARAEELAQDVFMKIYRSASSYQPSAKFKTYLFRVATNHCMNERRRGVYHAPHESAEERPLELASVDNASPEQFTHGREMQAALGVALEALSPRERAAFSMCRFEGMAYKDIADALETSEAAVKSLIHRATLAVARHLEPFGGPQVAHG
jgi:RNA polymerase sigma-70 factor (ECF subfamily)